ncbi:HEPN domain-containing protein [Tenacibaculum dicentrarchi]|nr:hypothetical protein [Tenacibaculum dicentrarchi]WBX67866.1 HEPN domain-containing protein [Tenacibaculum dicentrarchi]
MRKFRVLIITNSKSDLSKLKFPEFDILNTKSDEFKEFLKLTKVPEFSFNLEIYEEQQFDNHERFAIIKKDKTNYFGEMKIDRIYNFLLLMFPSSLAVEHFVHFKLDDGKLLYVSDFKFEVENKMSNEFLEFNESKIELINNFIENFYENHLKIGFVKSSIQNYINAFDNPHYYHFSFIALCISLESITNGNTELLYRIRRNVAILCGKDIESSQTIFDNINTIYKLRSKIVHGSEFSDEKVYDFMNYLQCIVSKTIIESLIHNISSLELLNKNITQLGFGNRNLISENWSEIKLNDKIERTIYEKI